MQQWEFTYVSVSTNSMGKLQDEATLLCALGWEPVGVTSSDQTVGVNRIVLAFKRPIQPPPPPATDEEWQPDPTGRFDKRRWDATLKVWTAEAAMMDAKTLHTDPPRQ